MYGLNAVALVFFGCVNVLAYRLCRRPAEQRRRIVTALCAALLGGNLLRYGVLYPFARGAVVLPVEFSTVAYFAVPAILLTRRKRLYSWAPDTPAGDVDGCAAGVLCGAGSLCAADHLGIFPQGAEAAREIFSEPKARMRGSPEHLRFLR